MHPYFNLFGYDLPAYWAFGMLGLVFAVGYLILANRADRIPAMDVVHAALLAIIGAVVGSKLLYLVTILPLIIRNFDSIVHSEELLKALVSGGSVFYGGLLGALACIILYCRRYRIPSLQMFALLTPTFPLFHAFARVGCFFTGCCWGVPASFGFVFQNSLAAPNNVALFPVQLAEAAYNFLLFTVLLILRGRRRLRPLLLPLYLILYGLARFTLEFFRGDELRGGFLFLSTSQWIALLCVTGSILWILYTFKKQHNNDASP